MPMWVRVGLEQAQVALVNAAADSVVALAARIFPRCDHGLVRGEGTACGARAFYRIGNCFYCAAHREQGRVTAWPIGAEVRFGNTESMRFGDMLAVLGLRAGEA